MTSVEQDHLGGNMTTAKVVTMVVAAAAPMGAVLGVLPLALAIGTGPSMPATYVLVGLLLLCFAVGYAAMSKKISSAGGFYTYVAKGLGRPAALSAAVVAVVAYVALALQLTAGTGYFANIITLGLGGPDIKWWVFSGIAIVIVGLLGRIEANIAGSALMVLLALEILALLWLDIAIIAHKGFDAFPGAAMSPSALFNTGSFGLGLMFAFSTYLGFESAAIYAEETKDPQRSIPRATYFSVVVITAFYAITAWVTVGALGVDNTQKVAGEQLGTLYFGLSEEFANSALTKIMQITLITSLLACMLALHNAASRYLFSVGRERAILPQWLGVPHAKFGSPARASMVVSLICVAVTVIYAVTGSDPYLNMGTMATGMGTLGVLILEALAAAAIIAHFGRLKEHTGAIVATAVGFVGLVAAVILVVKNFSTLVGTDSTLVNSLPWLVIAAAIVGVGYGFVLRGRGGPVYDGIGSFDESEPLAESAVRHQEESQ
ncbi:MAG: APC family permease [Nocardioidaceae bacterium]